jgi:F-type H+-transporting ATPase subunit b
VALSENTLILNMPQFDFSTYSSQIFWFLVCFVTLYAAVARVILPRISNIVATRKNLIDSDKSATDRLDKEIEDLHSKTMVLRQESNQKYQAQIEEVTKEAQKQRDKSFEDLKDKIEEMTKKSRNDLKSFVENSKNQSAKAVQDLVQTIKTKILN